MKAVLRVALSSFAFVPLQRLLNGIGGAIVVLALILVGVGISVSSPAAWAGSGLALLGMILVLLTPLSAGGVALRYASTRSQLHLRPHGRLYLLLGAALTVTVIAVLFTLLMLMLHRLPAADGAHAPSGRFPPLPEFFLGMWVFTALVWIGTFVMSSTRLFFALIGFAPLGIAAVGRQIGPALPGLPMLSAICLGIAIAFVAWYARTDFVRRPNWIQGGTPAGVAHDLLISAVETDGPPTRTRALRQYLTGAPSLRGPLITGACLLIFSLLALNAPRLSSNGGHHATLTPIFFLLTMGFFTMATASRLIPSARLLWLRAGSDRRGLFGLTERHGLVRCALTLGVVLVGLMAFDIAERPELSREILAFGLASAAVATCLFYAGMCLTHGWNAGDIALAFCMALLNVVALALVRPVAGSSLPLALWATALAVPAALLLRWLALRMWLVVDWRVARIPSPTR